MTREEVLPATGRGAPTVIWVKVGAKNDGTLTAIQTKMYFPRCRPAILCMVYADPSAEQAQFGSLPPSLAERDAWKL